MTTTQKVIERLTQLYTVSYIKVVPSIIAESYIFATVDTTDVVILVEKDSDINRLCSTEYLYN